MRSTRAAANLIMCADTSGGGLGLAAISFIIESFS
jgi:hypothetical protein